MKPEGSIRTTFIEIEDKVRKSLHPLQPTATDKENLVGAGRKLRSSIVMKTPMKNDVNNKTRTDISKVTNKSKVMVKNEINKKITDKSKPELKNKETKKIFKDADVQTEIQQSELVGKVLASDLTSEAEPSPHYWKLLAERRAVALKDALEENEALTILSERRAIALQDALEEKEILTEKLQVYKEMLEESQALVEVLKEMIGDDENVINNSLDESCS